MSDDDWMQQVRTLKQPEIGQMCQPRATSSGYIITFTLPQKETEMSGFGQESPEQRHQRVNEMHRQSNKLYKQSRLTEALVLFDRAIELGETLDQNVPEYRYVLALAHSDKGLSLTELGTPKDLKNAITAYNKAIQLGGTLDQNVSQYCRILALAHNNKGLALTELGTPKDLKNAITAYSKAIRLGETLDQNMPEYRYILALAYNNKGFALARLGTPKDRKNAITAYNEAIQLGETLDQNVPEYRYILALAYNNKGFELARLGTPKDLADAIVTLDKAIRLGGNLDLSVERHRTNLIRTYINKGYLAVISPRMALDLFQKAIALADGGQGLFINGIEFTAKAYLGAASAYLRLADPASAADAANEGLTLLKELEINGVFRLRSLREDLFATTLDATVQAQQFQWVPDIIREHLDPEEPGSAPASEALHAAALKALVQSLVALYSAPRRAVAATLTDLEALARQLADWRTRYFSGEASSAWLRAQDCERRGLPERAEAILRDYIQARPLDPCGPKVLGDLYAQRRQSAAAEAAYRDAARVCARSTPPQDDLHARSISVVTLARCLLDLRLLQLSDAAPAAAAAPDPIATLGQGYDQLHTLLTGDFVHDLVNHSPPDLKGRWWERLKPELEALWQRAAAQRDDWLTKHAQGMVQEERDKAFEAVLMLTKGLFKGLGRSWEDCQQAVLCALRELRDYRTARSDQPDLEELVAAAVREAVERSARALADSELQAPYEYLHHTLEPLWDRVLKEEEKRFLGCGWRGLQHSQDEDMRRFAGLHLGLAVEWSLADHLYEPLKAHWSQSGKPDLGTHRLAPRIDRFLTRTNQHLMLGEMVGALNSALKHAHDTPSDLEKPEKTLAAFITGFLRQMPNPAPLLDQQASAARREQLQLINGYRTDCAHIESPPSQEALQTMWNMVVADPEHAFFRYFGAALLPPPDPASPT